MKALWYIALWLVVAGHFAVVGMNLAAFALLAFIQPWYIASPLMTFIAFISFTKIDCPVTRLENLIRVRLNLRPIHTFVGHYFVRPFKALSNNG